MRMSVGKNKLKILGGVFFIFSNVSLGQHAFAEKVNQTISLSEDNVQHLSKSKSTQNFSKIHLNELSNFSYNPNFNSNLPLISKDSKGIPLGLNANARKSDIFQAIKVAVLRHPTISQSISSLASQGSNIDVARASYYPQLSGGITTGDMTSGSQRGRQLLSLNATQMLYDFGKTKSSVSIQQAKLLASQAEVLVAIDEIAYEVATAIINVRRYEESSRIAKEQIKGIARIAEIANLRANAGISSQADPIQAQSYLEAAESNLIVQQTQLNIYKQRLRTLLGQDVSNMYWDIPDSLIAKSNIYEDPEFNQIPKMIAAKAQVDVATAQKKQTSLSRYPTLNVKGTLSQAINGTNPNNNKDDGTDSSIMLEATSNFYQGGAIAAQTRSANYAENAAKARVDSIYLDTLNSIRLAQEQVENKKRQMNVLVAQQATTVRTKELYQEQYKLGTRTAVDLLNAEQAIHSANVQIQTTRYDILDNLVQYILASGKTREVYALHDLMIQGVEIQP